MEYNLLIPVFNRLHSLKRLLSSLEAAEHAEKLHLYISADNGASADVLAFCNAYTWSRGSYNFRVQDDQLGVDRHNLHCLQRILELEHALILEDDLTVSPSIFRYLDAACELSKRQVNIAGISTYCYPRVESFRFDFNLIPNDEFIFYQKRPSSKGCFYSRGMLAPFLESFKQPGDYSQYHLPENVRKWSDEVWEKIFYAFLLTTDRYLMFPRYSLSTDWGDPGVHMQKETEQYSHHSSLYHGSQFPGLKFEDSSNVYDQFYEIEPSRLKMLCPGLSTYDLEVDLRGTKDLDFLESEYLISSRHCSSPEKQWGRKLKPELNNLILDAEGSFYSLGKKKDFSERNKLDTLKEDFMYYYPDSRLIDLLRMKWKEVKARFS